MKINLKSLWWRPSGSSHYNYNRKPNSYVYKIVQILHALWLVNKCAFIALGRSKMTFCCRQVVRVCSFMKEIKLYTCFVLYISSFSFFSRKIITLWKKYNTFSMPPLPCLGSVCEKRLREFSNMWKPWTASRGFSLICFRILQILPGYEERKTCFTS